MARCYLVVCLEIVTFKQNLIADTMKGVHIINDETKDKRYVQIELDALRKAQKSGKSVIAFLEDLEDIIDVELSRGEKGTPWEEVKEQLRREQTPS